MTDRLDRVEELLAQTAERLDQTSERLDQTSERLDQTSERLALTVEQQVKNTTDIDTLLGAVSSNEVGVRELSVDVRSLTTAIGESNQRFDVLRLEAVEDRQETRQLFNDAVDQMERDRARFAQRFEAVIAQAEADREENRRRFNAQQENIQRLFVRANQHESGCY